MSENINEIAGVEPSFKMDELKFNEKGLIPAIVQDLSLIHISEPTRP